MNPKDILWQSRPHWSIVVPNFFVNLLLVLVVGFAWYYFYPELLNGVRKSNQEYVHLSVGILALGFLMITTVKNLWFSWITGYTLTKDTLFTTYFDIRSLRKREDRMPVYRIVDYGCEQGIFFQNLYNCGDVLLETLDKTHPQLDLVNIKDHRYVAEVIYEIAENHKSRQKVQELNIKN